MRSDTAAAPRKDYAPAIADFFVRFAGELSEDDRIALDRPDFKLYENDERVGAGSSAGATPDYHVVRVSARDADEAQQEIVRVLQRHPEALEVLYAI